MKTGRNLVALAQELQRQAEAKSDYLTPVPQIHIDSQGIKVNGHGSHSLTDHAHGQLAAHLEIPKKHYDKLRTNYPVLFEQEANELLQKEHGQETRLVRTLDGKARAYHSNRYQVIDNLPIASHALELFQQHNAKVLSCEVTEARMYLKAVFADTSIPFPLANKGFVHLGISIKNSEIGLGPVQLEAFALMSWCENGAMMPDSKFRQIHLGRRNDANDLAIEYLADDTRHATAKAFELQARDFMNSIADKKKLIAFVESMAIAQEEKIERSPVEAVEVLTKNNGLNDLDRDGILAQLLRGDAGTVELNKFGLSQAVTAYSQLVPDYDKATDLEILGGQIIAMPRKSWNEIAVN